MKILFLSNNPISKPLADWLKNTCEVLEFEEPLTPEIVKKYEPDWIISYNYRYIIKPDVIALIPGKILNLHTSYLPWNKGVYPNLWSFIEGTPKGVTIHEIDTGLDTGAILAQKKIELSEDETVKSSYEKLHQEIQTLFKEIWEKKCSPITQVGEGSKHSLKESKLINDILEEMGYDIPISTFLEEYRRRGL